MISEPQRVDKEFVHVSGEFVTLQGALAGLLPLGRVYNVSSIFVQWSEDLQRWKLAVMIYAPVEAK